MHDRAKEDGGEGTHAVFLDMGGQSEFWQIIGSFLRNKAIITVFGRLDEIQHNILTGSQLEVRRRSNPHTLDRYSMPYRSIPA